VFWNDDAARILGVSAAGALGTPWADCLTLVRGDDSGGATLPVEILQLGGWHGQLHVRTRDRSTKWLRAHIQPIARPEFNGKTGVAAMFWEGEGADRAVSGRKRRSCRTATSSSTPGGGLLANLASIIVDANELGAASWAPRGRI